MHLDGVKYYTKGYVLFPVCFPDGDVCCKYCAMCVNDPTYKMRSICLATREIIAYPESVGLNCPLVLDKEIEK